jgi:hypothetical protein
MMHEREKSDPAVVAVKPVNNAERSAAESVEPRAGAEGNASQQSTHRAQNRACVSQALERIRQVVSPSLTQGGSRMRESRTYGSVRGALRNERPYRDRFARNDGVSAGLNRLARIRHRGRQAAVDRERLAIDVGRVVAGEKQFHRRDLVRLAGALHSRQRWWATSQTLGIVEPVNHLGLRAVAAR